MSTEFAKIYYYTTHVGSKKKAKLIFVDYFTQLYAKPGPHETLDTRFPTPLVVHAHLPASLLSLYVVWGSHSVFKAKAQQNI